MRLTFIAFICLIPIFSFGQQRGAYNDGTKVYYPYERFSISASPFALLDSYNGSAYKLGLSFRPSRDFRITADGGGYIPGLTSSLSVLDNMKGYHFRGSIGTSEDFFIFAPIGLGVSYSYKRHDFTFNSRTMENPMDYTASVNKFAHSFNGYANINLHFGWRFYLEFRAELGVRYREITNSHNELLSDSEKWWDSWFAGRVETKKSFVPNFALNVRMNYSLWVDY